MTDLGRKLAQTDDEEKPQVFVEVLRQLDIYKTTLEYIHHNKFGEITVADVGAHWSKHFASQVSGKEEHLRAEVACFMKLVTAAELGKYVLGRGVQSKGSRLEISRDKLDLFIGRVKIATPATEVEEALDSELTEEIVAESEPEEQMPTDIGLGADMPPPPSGNPSVHIDIQIHIQPGAETDQIKEIFKNMAKYLYGKTVE